MLGATEEPTRYLGAGLRAVAAEGSSDQRALAEHDVPSHCLAAGLRAAAAEVQHAVGLRAAVATVPVRPWAAALDAAARA